jgi:AmmeMemoRadiSam system protein B
MIREPAVAGRFYPGDATSLAAELDRCLGPAPAERRTAIGVVVPHAGYVYSGAVAGAVYARVAVPARAILLGPNHTGQGAGRALAPDEGWRTPLGIVPVDATVAARLATATGVERDARAHRLEHALEVQVPFLQRVRPDVAIAPLVLAHLPWRACEALGRDVAEAAREAGALLVASSDMSHHVPASRARALDARALERILALDPEGLYEVVQRDEISMCGIVPATVMLVAARALGATHAELVRYSHSGEVTGDDDEVVGYAGVIVS